MSPSKKYASEEGEAGSRKRNGRNEKKALESVLSAIEIRGDRYGVPLLLIFAFESLVKRVIVRPVLSCPAPVASIQTSFVPVSSSLPAHPSLGRDYNDTTVTSRSSKKSQRLRPKE